MLEEATFLEQGTCLLVIFPLVLLIFVLPEAEAKATWNAP